MIFYLFPGAIVHQPVVGAVQCALKISPTLEAGKQCQTVERLNRWFLLSFQNIPHLVQHFRLMRLLLLIVLNVCLAELLLQSCGEDFQIILHSDFPFLKISISQIHKLFLSNWAQKYILFLNWSNVWKIIFEFPIKKMGFSYFFCNFAPNSKYIS